MTKRKRENGPFRNNGFTGDISSSTRWQIPVALNFGPNESSELYRNVTGSLTLQGQLDATKKKTCKSLGGGCILEQVT